MAQHALISAIYNYAYVHTSVTVWVEIKVQPVVASPAAASLVSMASEETAVTGAVTTAHVKPIDVPNLTEPAKPQQEVRQSSSAIERDVQVTVPGCTSGGNPVTGEHCSRSVSVQCAIPSVQRHAHPEQIAGMLHSKSSLQGHGVDEPEALAEEETAALQLGVASGPVERQSSVTDMFKLICKQRHRTNLFKTKSYHS